jgi:hypothetical protein
LGCDLHRLRENAPHGDLANSAGSHMTQRGRPHGTTKPPTYRAQVMLDEPVPRLGRIKRLEWIIAKLMKMIEQIKKGK